MRNYSYLNERSTADDFTREFDLLKEDLQDIDRKERWVEGYEREILQLARDKAAFIDQFKSEDPNVDPISKMDKDSLGVLEAYNNRIKVLEEQIPKVEGHLHFLRIDFQNNTYALNKALEREKNRLLEQNSRMRSLPNSITLRTVREQTDKERIPFERERYKYLDKRSTAEDFVREHNRLKDKEEEIEHRERVIEAQRREILQFTRMRADLIDQFKSKDPNVDPISRMDKGSLEVLKAYNETIKILEEDIPKIEGHLHFLRIDLKNDWDALNKAFEREQARLLEQRSRMTAVARQATSTPGDVRIISKPQPTVAQKQSQKKSEVQPGRVEVARAEAKKARTNSSSTMDLAVPKGSSKVKDMAKMFAEKAQESVERKRPDQH